MANELKNRPSFLTLSAAKGLKILCCAQNDNEVIIKMIGYMLV